MPHQVQHRTPQGAGAGGPALLGLRVLELGASVAGSYCGKIFADFGAEVIKVEPADGCPLRRNLHPLLRTKHGETVSGLFAWLNTNKKSVVVEAETTEGLRRIAALAALADVVIDARPLSEQDGSKLRQSDLRNANGDLVVVSVSAFGQDGPYRDLAVTESVCRALAGTIAGVGPVEGPPFIANDSQAGIITGLSAFIAAAAGVYGRQQGGRTFAVSMHETLVHTITMDTAQSLIHGRPRRRYGINRFGQTHPASIYQAKEGWIGTTIQTPAQWRSTCELLGRPELVNDPRFRSGAERAKAADALDAILAPIFATRTAQEWFDAGRMRRLAFAIVPSMADLLQQKVHRNRGAFGEVQIDDLTFEGPVLPHRLMGTPPAPGGRAPRVGEDDAHYPAVEMRTSARRTPAPDQLPLQGLRIIDLTMGWAGPMATRYLADLGADVVKVESCAYPDWWRGIERSERYFAEKFYEKSPFFNTANVNKRGITLDLTKPEGLEILKDLVKDADAVIESYAADVLPKLGISYDELRAINASLVMVSMPAFTSTGLWSDGRGYGTTIEQASGLPTISGDPSWPPTMSQYAYADPYGGLNAATAMLVALLHRQRTGEGQFVEMAHVGGMLALAAAGIVEQSATGRPPRRIGNRHPLFAPHGAFRCAGQDQWVVIAVRNDDDWKEVSAAIGRPDLARVEDRRAREAELEDAICEWSRQQSPEHAMAELQRRGVPAARVMTSTDVIADPHLAARGFWQELTRPVAGAHKVSTAPFREGAAPYAARSPAPTVGQHNAEVLGDELGLSPATLADLEKNGVIGTELTPLVTLKE